MKSIIILSGPIGAGKRLLPANWLLRPGPIAHIEGDTFWSYIAKSAGKDRHKNFRMIMTAMTAAAVPYKDPGGSRCRAIPSLGVHL